LFAPLLWGIQGFGSSLCDILKINSLKTGRRRKKRTCILSYQQKLHINSHGGFRECISSTNK
jgi:hypothetical protein